MYIAIITAREVLIVKLVTCGRDGHRSLKGCSRRVRKAAVASVATLPRPWQVQFPAYRTRYAAVQAARHYCRDNGVHLPLIQEGSV